MHLLDLFLNFNTLNIQWGILYTFRSPSLNEFHDTTGIHPFCALSSIQPPKHLHPLCLEYEIDLFYGFQSKRTKWNKEKKGLENGGEGEISEGKDSHQ